MFYSFLCIFTFGGGQDSTVDKKGGEKVGGMTHRK